MAGIDSLVAAGDRCFVDEDYEGAVQQYTQALDTAPAADVYEARANAYIKLDSFVEAAEDASRAIELDGSNAKAHLRKGIAMFHLEEYETALEALQRGQELAPSMGAFKGWISKCQQKIAEEGGPATAAPAAPTSAVAAAAPAPTAAAPSPPAAPAQASAQPASEPAGAAASSSNGHAPGQQQQQQAPAVAPRGMPTQDGKYRHQWYQIADKVVVDVYVKALPRERLRTEFGEKHLKVEVLDEAGESEWDIDVELYGRIVPDRCKVEVLRTKVEITMPKADAAFNWGSLHSSEVVAAPNYSAPAEPGAARVYPSSVKNPKDWSKVDSELAELEKKGELDEGDPLNAFFKKIFSQGDDDQRRAMMKSYVESNGTVLSTNWNEVGSKKVDCTPPEGMVAKKWGE